MSHAVVGGWELSYGMVVLFANRGNENELETFLRNYPDISFDFIKPYSYWARIENVRRYQDTISFCTWDNNGVPVKLSTPHYSVWIIKEPGAMPNILDEFVDKDFVPKREDEIMVDGSNLKNGMRVLIADTTARMSIDELLGENPEPRYVFMLRKYNRWCTISNVRRNGKKLSFTGTYDDGSMYRHDASYQSIWYVDRASMVERGKKKRAEVLDLINQAFGDIDKAFLRKPPGPLPDPRDIVDKIYTILDVR